jgi:glycosyltransferase involved in cell wall biosynthesis
MQKVTKLKNEKDSVWRDEPENAVDKGRISVIVTLSEYADGIQEIYRKIREFLEIRGVPFEIIFVDNGVGGEDIRWLEERSRAENDVKLIRFRSVFSESSALDAGFKASSGNIVIYTTSRVRIDPLGLSNLVDALSDRADIVVGWRYPRSDSRLNRLVSRIFNKITSSFGGLKLHDLNSGVFAARKEVLQDVLLYGDLDKFLPVLAHKQGYRVREEKIAQLPGTFRVSYYTKEYFVRLLDIITIVFLTNYSKKPIHFLGFLGMVFSLAGGALSFYLFIYRITGQGPIAGRPLLLLGILLFVIGIQMIAIGLLGEMMIYIHASEIKEYNIEEIVQRGDGKDEADRSDPLL